MDPRKATSGSGASGSPAAKSNAGKPATAGKPAPGKPAVPATKRSATASSAKGGGKARGGPYKANLGARVGAALLDAVVAAVPAIAVFFAGGLFASALVSIAYLLVRDGLGIAPLDYASIGKKILGLHVELEESGQSKLDPVSSLKRNLTLVPGLLILPLLWSTSAVLALAVAAAPPLVELVMALTDPNGLRLGDRIAATKVLD